MDKNIATLGILATIVFLFFMWLTIRAYNYPTWVDNIPTAKPTSEFSFETWETPTASSSATLNPSVTVFPTGMDEGGEN